MKSIIKISLVFILILIGLSGNAQKNDNKSSIQLFSQTTWDELDKFFFSCQKENCECYNEINASEVFERTRNILLEIRRNASIEDLNKSKDFYSRIDAKYTQCLLNYFHEKPTSNYYNYGDWLEFYHRLEEMLRYLKLYNNELEDEETFLLIKNNIQGLKSKDTLVLNNYRKEYFNKRVFNDTTVSLILRFDPYLNYIEDNMNDFETFLVNEIINYDPFTQSKIDLEMFYLWQYFFIKKGKIDLFNKIIMSKKEIYERAGKLKDYHNHLLNYKNE